MKPIRSLILALAITLGVLPYAFSQPISDAQNTIKPEFTPYGRLQTTGFGQSLTDNIAKDQRLYLYLKQARFGMLTNYGDTKFDFQIALGGEDQVVASSGMSLSLLDFSVDIPFYESLRLKVGQFKVPYGREAMTNAGSLSFADRSIDYNAFKIGRDVGIALYGTSGNITGTVGIFTGGGRDVPLRFIPENMGIPMMVARLGYNSNYDANVMNFAQTSYNPQSGYAFSVNALYTKDSRIGHSTVLNVKSIDKSLLLDNMWNPYIGRTPYVKGDFWQVGGDAAFRTRLAGSTGFSGEAELNYGSYANVYGSIEAAGGRAQLALRVASVELAARYSFIAPDSKFAYTDSKGQLYPILDSRLINEATLGATYYLNGDNLKLTADLPLLFNVPVITDPHSGAYVLTEQADQVSYVASPTNAPIGRQTVVEARLQLQYSF